MFIGQRIEQNLWTNITIIIEQRYYQIHSHLFARYNLTYHKCNHFVNWLGFAAYQQLWFI